MEAIAGRPHDSKPEDTFQQSKPNRLLFIPYRVVSGRLDHRVLPSIVLLDAKAAVTVRGPVVRITPRSKSWA